MKSRDLIQLGAYVPGGDPETDRAITLYPALQRFLQQGMFDAATMEQSLRELEAALQEEPRPAAGGAPGRSQRNR